MTDIPDVLTNIIQDDKELSINQQVRLLLASIRLTYKTTSDLNATITAMSWDIQSIKEHLKDHTDAIMKLDTTVTATPRICPDCPKDNLRNNYLHNLSYYLQLHPKLTTTLLVFSLTTLLIFLALWTDPNLRHMIFEFLHFPASVTDALSR